MAQRVSVEFVDDVDGKAAEETIPFGLDGTTFEIDLSKKNASALRRALDPWVQSARRVGGRKSRGTAALVPTGVDNSAVRAWARSNGHEVSARGRISSEIIEKYRAAGN
jgi:Lsr2